LSASPPATSASAAARRAAGVGGHPRALFETQLSFGHDHFAGLQPFVDHQILVHALSGRDRPLFDG